MALLPSPLLNVLVISVKSITYIKTLLKHEQKKTLTRMGKHPANKTESSRFARLIDNFCRERWKILSRNSPIL